MSVWRFFTCFKVRSRAQLILESHSVHVFLQNLGCCLFFAVLAIAAGALLIDQYEPINTQFNQRAKNMKNKGLATGVINLVLAVVYIIDGLVGYSQGG